MSPQDYQRAKLLSPETSAWFLEEAAELSEFLCTITFSADPIERETAILAYVEAQAKRNKLLALVNESADTRAALVESQSLSSTN